MSGEYKHSFMEMFEIYFPEPCSTSVPPGLFIAHYRHSITVI